MNEPTERAQQITGKTTARDILAMFRRVAVLSLRGQAVEDRPSYSDAFTFALCFEGAGGSRSEIQVPGWVSNGTTSVREVRNDSLSSHRYGRYTEAYRPLRGFWFLRYNDTLRSVLALLPRDAQVAFHVYLDAGTNGNLVDAKSSPDVPYVWNGLHCDHLYLEATWTERGKRKEARFLIDTSTGAHNSARFGAPRYEHDKGGGAE